MATFREFVNRKQRESTKHLGLIKKTLEKQGMLVNDFLKEEDPYVFVKSNNQKLSFDGVRIYQIGGDMCYRIQKESKTHPYGKAYLLDVEGMYDDLISDRVKEEKAGKKVMKAIAEELKNFFRKSADAERELQSGEFERKNDPLGRTTVKSTGTDYSNQVSSKVDY